MAVNDVPTAPRTDEATGPAADRREETDVVIVGSRCAGSAAAIALARRGHRVIALDGASFPSDTLSTHLFWPSTWAEIDRVGALARVRALGAPEHTHAGVLGGGVTVLGPYHATEGIDYGSSVRRTGLDMALVETAREAGAEVRERTRVTDLLHDADGRVTGVRWKDRDGARGTIDAQLVIGADGRNSTVAKLVGATNHHEFENRRLMAFAYYRDPREEERHIAMQWRQGDELATVFPCDGDLSLILLMSPATRADEFRADPTGTFEDTVAGFDELTARLQGCERDSKVRTSYKHPSYFRHSHGPGWALAGDAGHFKDPVTAQGIRDALRFGRLLGEAVAPALDHGDAAVDGAVRAWERDRDAQCLDMYQWANGLGLAEDVSPIEASAYAWLAARPEGAGELLDVFSRVRKPQSLFTPKHLAIWVRDALRDPSVSNRAVLRTLRRDVGRELRRMREHAAFTRRRAASEAARTTGVAA
jgi:2-polyprenyl-6-methoxyphenol hydroxylase-like FAD-dependent oxidoreductase